MITVSVLIPAYNEEATILEILRKVKAVTYTGVKFEVLVIDDGSNDCTIELLEANLDLYGQLIKMPQNGGKGAGASQVGSQGPRRWQGATSLYINWRMQMQENEAQEGARPSARAERTDCGPRTGDWGRHCRYRNPMCHAMQNERLNGQRTTGKLSGSGWPS